MLCGLDSLACRGFTGFSGSGSGMLLRLRVYTVGRTAQGGLSA